MADIKSTSPSTSAEPDLLQKILAELKIQTRGLDEVADTDERIQQQLGSMTGHNLEPGERFEH